MFELDAMGFQDADTASLGELDGGRQELGLPHSGRRLDDDDAALGMIGQAGHAIDQETGMLGELRPSRTRHG
ncbi:MAG TPA: hypothetical protein VFT20_02500, partial [Candidatus Limnocylindrales bacterium]|nr:hypothetical protein [Candidatus Limnocylindrales bacterium]